MTNPLTPEQRATLRADCDRAVAAALTLPVRHVVALLDAADERDRLAADLDAMQERLAQGATLPQPVSDAAALYAVALHAILATPGGVSFRTMATNLACLSPGEMAIRTSTVADEMVRLSAMTHGLDDAAGRKALVDLGRRILGEETPATSPPAPPMPAPTAVSDPDLYARMSRPRPAAEVSAAYNAFWQDVSVARARHGIRDVVIVSTVAVSYDDGEPMAELRVGYRGDSALVVPLLARALGGMRRDSERRLDDIAAGRDEEG